MIRLFDIIFSSIALIFLLPLFVPVCILLKFTGEGEIFFLQSRVGINKKEFKLLKFVTMIKDSPNIGTGTVTMKGDPRVLPFGKILRKTKINELPQLLNVLFGDMSLIGPRPQTEQCFKSFLPNSQTIIIKMKPGLSGIGPIIFRGEEEILSMKKGNLDFYDNILAPYKGRVEAWYHNRQNLLNYFVLILMTLWVIVFPKSNLIWRLFSTLPKPPEELASELNF